MNTTETTPPEPQPQAVAASDSAALAPTRSRVWTRLFLFWGLTLAAILIYGPYLLGNLPVGADNTLFYAPFFAMRWQGGPPLWSPFSLSGTALLDNLQAALLYPLRWPFYFIPDWREYFGPFIFLHYIIALAGMAGLLRALRLRAMAVLGGAVLFAIGGHMAGRVINLTIFMGCCWLPWLLWGAIGRRRLHGALTTLGLAMIALIGSPHLIFYGLIAWAILFFWLTLLPGGEDFRFQISNFKFNKFAWGLLGHRGASLLLAFVLAAPTLLPGVLRSQVSIRTWATVESNLADSATFSEIPHLFLGGNLTSIYPEFIDKCCYVGPVALLLILWLACRAASWRDRRFLGGLSLVLVGLFFALGRTVGLDHVLPHIPVVKNLAGAARALAVTAAGLALLGALALDALTARRTRRLALISAGLGLAVLCRFLIIAWHYLGNPADAPAFTANLLQSWLFGPCALNGTFFPLLDAAWGLLGAAAILCLAPASDRLRQGLLCALLFLLCWHFAPRVLPPAERSEFFDPPRQVAWLQSRQERQPLEPFRVAGYDPLRLHDGEFLSPWKFVYLMPNVAAIYGLEDINGFDPLIHIDYLEFFQRTGGRAPFNDPIRNLDLEHPDLTLFDTLGVRYTVGCPRDRRLTTVMLNLGVVPDQGLNVSAAEVKEWQPERAAAGPVTHWLIVSSLDHALDVPLGAEVARLHIEADEGAFDFPIRNGLETADFRAPNYPQLLRHPAFRAAGNITWWNNVPRPKLDYRFQFGNFRAVIPLGRALHVRRAEWRLVRADVIFNVAAQACRYAPAPTGDPWALRQGTEDDLAPVYEYLNARPRAVVAVTSATAAAELKLDPAQLNASAPGAAVSWLARGNNRLVLRVRAGQPSVLVLREMWDAGWKARVGNAAAPVLRVNGLLRGVRVPAGERVVTLVYRPRLPLILLLLAGAALAVSLAACFLFRGGRERSC